MLHELNLLIILLGQPEGPSVATKRSFRGASGAMGIYWCVFASGGRGDLFLRFAEWSATTQHEDFLIRIGDVPSRLSPA